MLSFDITDKNVRIIKGTESNGKIKIQSAVTLDLEDDVIVRGIPRDATMVATQLNQVLKANRMADKEAIVSVSSSQTIFKELQVPQNAKSSEFSKSVTEKMKEAVSVVDDTYSISYTIVKNEGLSESKDGTDSTGEVTVLATACPHEMIDAYREVFNLLNINLKSVVVASNCITKVLLADAKLKQKMPLLAVQIDKNFISMNVYENNQLSFSRFASIDASDYSDGADYILDAIHDNVFRMLQFQRNRSGEAINHIVFYGDTSERFRELADDMEQMGLSASVIAVPPLITGYENLEFSNYANAIGAMFKRDKETEKINLLELGGTAAIVTEKLASDKNFALFGGVICGVVAVVMVGIIAGLSIYDATIKSNIDKCNEYINSPDTIAQQETYQNRVDMLEKVRTYKDAAKLAYDAYNSKPVLDSAIIKNIEDTLSTVDSNIKISSFSYDSGVINVSFDVPVKTGLLVQDIPSKCVEALVNNENFYNVDYTGYTVTNTTVEGQVVTNPDGTTTQQAGSTTSELSCDLVLYLSSNSDSIADEYEESLTTQAVEDGTTDTDATNGEESAQ